MRELWIHSIIKQKEARDMKQFTSYWLPLNTEVNLPAVLMMWELWIHNIIKKNEAWDMKQFRSYSLPLNTEVNLPTVLMMWELWIHNIIKEKEAWDMKQFTSYWSPLNTEVNLPVCIDDVGIVDSQYHQRKGSTRYETVHKLLITIEHWSKLTSCIDDVGSQYHQEKGSMGLITIEHRSVLIHNIIKQKEARDMKQFTSYWLPLNTEVNLPAVLMMWELWIHNIIKQKEARDIETVHKLLITIEHWSKLTQLYWWCGNCGFTISSNKRKHEIWNSSQVIDYHWTLK